MTVRFTANNKLTATGSRNFFPSDIGSKIIAPTFWDAYVAGLEGETSVDSRRYLIQQHLRDTIKVVIQQSQIRVMRLRYLILFSE